METYLTLVNDMKQKKKKKTDPDAQDINPVIVQMSEKNGFLRGPFNLFLSGSLTWNEALEAMLTSLWADYRDNKVMLNKYIQRKTGIPTPPEMLKLPIPKKPQYVELSCPKNRHSDAEDAQVVS